MKKNITALALALAMVGTLAACGADRNPGNNNGSTTGSGVNGSNSTNASGASGTNPAGSGINGAGSNSSGVSAGQVSRRSGGTIYNGRTYWNDGQYAAGSNGQVYGKDGSALSRDLTQGARDIVRDTDDALGDIGRGIGNAARDITGTNANPGTPSWEPDSSAVRY